ncbi:MAG: ATP-dependent Clp protease adaptor ClpS [Bdellovibrionales bacterium]|nr:ATP-dependent Clp protease adaptor ClpS [Bdellovibrionales bacterium]
MESDVAVAQGRPRVKEPPRYVVLLHNDDYTTMDFVVEVLKRFFQKSEDQAVKLTLEIHTKGRAVAGIYTPEIAEAKAMQVVDTARSRGFPLKATAEPA